MTRNMTEVHPGSHSGVCGGTDCCSRGSVKLGPKLCSRQCSSIGFQLSLVYAKRNRSSWNRSSFHRKDSHELV